MTPFRRLDLIDRVDLTVAEADIVPEIWLTIAELDGPAAIDTALQQWEAALPGRFPGTVAYIRDRGLDIFLGRAYPGLITDSDIVLVYAVEKTNMTFPVVLSFGYPPTSPDLHPQCWPQFPEGLGRFHARVHNGFRTTYSGLLRLEDLRPISDYPLEPDTQEYEYVDENFDDLPVERRPSLDDLVITVRNGRHSIALDTHTPALNPWAISELIEPSDLDTWAAMDRQLMNSMMCDDAALLKAGYLDS